MSRFPAGTDTARYLRAADQQDWPMLAVLHQTAFPPGEGWSAESLATLAATPGTVALVAVDGAGPIGFVMARSAADEAEIITLAVLPAARRRRVGAALLTGVAGIVAARGAGRLFLEVAIDNEAARGLYQRIGFRQSGVRRRYYKRASSEVDALVLFKDLTDIDSSTMT